MNLIKQLYAQFNTHSIKRAFYQVLIRIVMDRRTEKNMLYEHRILNMILDMSYLHEVIFSHIRRTNQELSIDQRNLI